MVEVIRFTASWCGPCRMYKPQFEKAQEELTDVQFTTIDVDNDPQGLSGEYGVRSIPTTVFLVDNEKVATQVGVLTTKDLISKIQEL